MNYEKQHLRIITKTMKKSRFLTIQILPSWLVGS